MQSEHDQRISDRALLDVSKKPTDIAKQLGISRPKLKLLWLEPFWLIGTVFHIKSI